ncbi:MAG: small nuclear ribonucleoprotein [Candidatus Diapherotrites archaeon CG08_land_8_20_14_0_20_30_16]|nr:MAG: small nuclear ribonucleoprotein [Candidatus Diapherotrites archaeon CG08_land_8_20_14_0_20_30_16]
MTETKPFDFLNNSINKNVLILMKGNLRIRGKLKAFDVHMNLVLEEAEKLNEDDSVAQKFGKVIIRGDTIILVSP